MPSLSQASTREKEGFIPITASASGSITLHGENLRGSGLGLLPTAGTFGGVPAWPKYNRLVTSLSWRRFYLHAGVTDFTSHLFESLQFPGSSYENLRRRESWSTSLTDRVVDVLSQLDELGVAIHNGAQVRQYLVENPEVVDIVLHAAQAARDTFRPDTYLSLEMYHDPEIEDSYPTLYVRQDGYDPDIFDQLEIVQSAYEAELNGKSGWFLLTTDLQPPR